MTAILPTFRKKRRRTYINCIATHCFPLSDVSRKKAIDRKIIPPPVVPIVFGTNWYKFKNSLLSSETVLYTNYPKISIHFFISVQSMNWANLRKAGCVVFFFSPLTPLPTELKTSWSACPPEPSHSVNQDPLNLVEYSARPVTAKRLRREQ